MNSIETNTILRLILSAEDIRRAIARITHEILERNHGASDLALVGILRRGVPIANRISGLVQQLEGAEIPVGRLDIALYRDDFEARRPVVGVTDIPFDITGKTVVLVDEVLYTARTVRAAISALMDIGRPAAIQLAVLVDRGHRELPIKADYVGKNLPTSIGEYVDCRLMEVDGEDAVFLKSSVSFAKGA